MNRSALKPAAAVVGLGLLLGFLFGLKGGGERTFAEPKPAADFAYPDLSGKPVALSSFKGKVVLLDFWATWCDPCLDAIPELKKVQRELGPKGAIVVGVSMDARGREVVAPFVEKHGIDYPILLAESSPPKGWAIPGFPTTFLIDKQGLVLKRYLGAIPYEELAKDVASALAR